MMHKMIYKIWIFILCIFISTTGFSQDCECTNCPVPITDNGTFQGFLEVQIDGDNNLGVCPLQKVCFTIQHTWVGDLSVALTSPAGINYLVMADANNNTGGCGTDADNLDVCIDVGTGNPLTNNTDYICNGGVGNCLTGNWTVPCGGVTDPISGATQAPTCDLNDFNLPGTPVNGTWTLTVNDVCAQDVGSLTNWSLEFACPTLACFNCEPEGGNLGMPSFTGCFLDPALSNLSIPPSGDATTFGDYAYTYLIVSGGLIMGVDAGPDLSSYPPGSYQVCGLAYHTSAAAEIPGLVGQLYPLLQAQFDAGMGPFCGDLSDDCADVLIGPLIPPTILDTMVCIGDCIIVGGQQVCNSGPVTLQSWLGCDSVINVIMLPIIPAFTNIEEEVCSGECATIGNEIFCPGQYTLTLVNYQGCDSIVTINIIENEVNAVILPNPPPPLGCLSSEVTLDGAASMPIGNWEWSGPNGFIGNTPTITVSEPGVYSLTVINDAVNPPCVDTEFVTVTQDGNEPDLMVLEEPEICAGESVDLTTVPIVDQNGTAAIWTFHSNSPANAGNMLVNTTVSPIVTTTYYVLATFGNCENEVPIVVTVNPDPTADFTATSPICSNDVSLVVYTGTAGISANYVWDFGGGTAVPGVGQGPHEVTYPSAGFYTITLTVDENGCASEPFSQDVIVEDPVDAPIIDCGIITTSSVEFIWNDVPNNMGYLVNVITGQTGTQTGTTYFVDGLIPGEIVTIEVTAVGGGACGDATSSMTCEAQNCANIVLNIDAVADICLDGNNANITLNATATNGNGTGTGTWSGTGIIDGNLGIFDPTDAGVGIHTITYDFVEDGCDYFTTIDITVFDTPTADFTVISPVCTNQNSPIEYTGTAAATATFTWNFDGGTETPGTGIGPHDVQWNSGGTKTITLIVEENGCVSEQFSQTVEVDEPLAEPVINCNTTTNSIEFVWGDVPGADNYTVNVIAGNTGMMTGSNSYEVTGLMPGDIVTIEVIASGNNACGNSTVEATCEAQNCVMVDVQIDAVADICLDGNVTNITLNATQTGGAGGGTFTWSGDGIVDATAGTFDPTAGTIGANNILVTYEEGNCSYNGSSIINVFEVPTAEFSVDSLICLDDVSVINYTGNASSNATFTWNFDGGNATPGTGPGPHSVDWSMAGIYTIELTVEENGCTSTMMTQEVVVEDPIEIPDILCEVSTTTVEFSWEQIAGASTYNVTLISGATGTMSSDTSYLVTGLMPGDAVTIEVEAVNSGICPNTSAQQTCIASDCPTIDIVIDPVADVCLDAMAMPFDLTATITGGGNGPTTWSGDGITDTTNGTFDPSAANFGENTVTILYEENNCQYSEDLIINVFEQPIADFNVEENICLNGASLLTYQGAAGIGATYEWDFDTGNASPGIGQGPHEVTWAMAGTYTVSLTVTENDCPSEVFTQEVTVDEELPEPEITCITNTSSIEFIWDNIPGATGYDVVVISGATGTMSSDTSYLVTGLIPGDEVTIELTIEGNSACGNIVLTQTCIAQDCPMISIDIQNPSPVCSNGGLITMVSTVTGSNGTGNGTWEGACITDPNQGIFDPGGGQVGANEVIFTFTESGCVYTESIIIDVFPPPSSSILADTLICITESSMISFGGFSTPGMLFDWNFGDANADPGTGEGPHNVIWTTTGIKTVTLQVTDANGCVSDITTIEIQVDEELAEPIVNCNTTTESIEIIWNQVTDATDYVLNIISGQTGTMTSDTSYLITGLDPNTVVDFELIANGNTACGASSIISACTAQNCPTDIQINITPVPDICFGGFGVPFPMNVTVVNGNGGTGIWDGPGIIDENLGIFDMVVSGFGNHQVTYTYTEGNCVYTENTIVNIIPEPTADFEFDSPICQTESSTINFTGVASPNANYSWDFDGGVAVPGGNNPGPHEVTWATGGTKNVTLTVEDAGCESFPVTYQIEVENPLPNPVVNCNTTTESVEFTWADVPGAIDYIITVTSGQTGTQTNPTTFLVENLDPEEVVSIEIEVVGDGVCGNIIFPAECSATDCPNVQLNITPVSAICLTENTAEITLIVNVVGGSGGNGTWNGNGITDATNGIFDPMTAGLGMHQIDYDYDENNCSYNNSITIEVVAPPTADAGNTFTLTCGEPGNSVQLGGSGTSTGANISYSWELVGGTFPGNATIANPVVDLPGTYILTVTNDALNCSSESTVIIDAAQAIPIPEIVVSDVACFGDSDGIIEVVNVQGGVEPYLYSLNNGEVTAIPEFTDLPPGAFSLTVTDDNDCANTVTIIVGEPDELQVELITLIEGDNVILLGDTIGLLATFNIPADSVDVIEWFPNENINCDTCTSILAFPIETTTFSVLIESDGCEAEDDITIIIDEPKFPNVISVNGDGKNDTFVIPGLEKYDNPRMTIVNRWGSVVWDSQPYQNEWGGTNDKGKPLPEGTYYYVLRLDLQDSEIITGHVTIIR